MTDSVFCDTDLGDYRLSRKYRSNFPCVGHAQSMTSNWSLVKTNVPVSRSIIGHAILPDMDKSDRPFSDIAERIVWHREEFEDLNQKEYAKRAGVTRSTLNNWESGDYRLSIDGALKLRETFGLSLDFMYVGIDDALPMTIRQAWRGK